MSYTINPNAKNKWARNAENTMDLSLETDASSVYLDNGRTLEQEIGEGSMVSNVATVYSAMSKIIDGTLDGAYESLVFKGKSLVNLATHSKRQNINVQNLLDSNGRLSWNTTGAWGKVGFTVQGKPNSTYCVKYGDKHTTLGIYVRYVDGLSGTTQPITTLNSTCKKFTTDTTGIFTLTLEQGEATTDSWIQDFMILEYIEGIENWEIPYFTGLCDVKMPILRNVGKNLFDGKTSDGTISPDNGSDLIDSSYDKTDFIKVKQNETYFVSNVERLQVRCFVYNENKEFIRFINSVQSFATTNNECFVRFRAHKDYNLKDMQLEQGTVATAYEDHKTNILRTSEEIVLREVGGVCDTYNPLTGEYVRRIGEIVLDGSDDEKWALGSWWTPQVETMGFEMPLSTKGESSLVDKLIHGKFNTITSTDIEYLGVSYEWQCLGIRIKRSKLSTEDITGLKMYLSQNPITVQYELAEPITTIVEPLTIPFAYQNGHVILESGYEGQSLLPTLEYSTVVNKTGLVENVAKTIQRQEKQLTMLEKMLIQNIINLDYNNTLLTLKNEMEEML